MQAETATYAPNVILAPAMPRARVWGRAAAVLLVVAFAGLTALAAQWEILLPFTPVPISGQTFAVLLAGAALGSRLGASSQALYLGVGIVGFPVFSGGDGGWQVMTGATAGYLVGFVVAAWVVGRMAERHADRKLWTAVPMFVAGSLVIYACGVAGLMLLAGMGPAEAVVKGVVPFLVGDALKAAAAGGLLPLAWKLRPGG